jgi:CubicO group peptidase (beta-lactamase class C family)
MGAITALLASDSVHHLARACIASGYAPGMTALIARREEVEAVVVGNKSMNSQEPLQRDSIFRITSMTKPVSAVATMMLIEDGKLRLEEPVDRLLPELSNRRVLQRIWTTPPANLGTAAGVAQSSDDMAHRLARDRIRISS